MRIIGRCNRRKSHARRNHCAEHKGLPYRMSGKRFAIYRFEYQLNICFEFVQNSKMLLCHSRLRDENQNVTPEHENIGMP